MNAQSSILMFPDNYSASESKFASVVSFEGRILTTGIFSRTRGGQVQVHLINHAK